MKDILFIHGAYHAGWCWDEVIKLLPPDKFTCHAIDLPGQGKNQAIPKNKIKTQNYVDYTLDYIEQNNLTSTVVISHSLGGVTLSKIIELIPEKISQAFFLTSVILDGSSFLEKFPEEVRKKYKQIAQEREDGSIPPNIERIKQLLFSGSKDSSELEGFLAKLEPQPISPYLEVINLNDFKKTSVPVTYIKCSKDNSLPAETFNEIFSNLPQNAQIIEIDANHEAMFSNPKAVAEILLRKA